MVVKLVHWANAYSPMLMTLVPFIVLGICTVLLVPQSYPTIVTVPFAAV